MTTSDSRSGPYKVAPHAKDHMLGPGDKMYYCRSEVDAISFAKFANEVRRLALEEAIGVVEKLFDEYDLNGGPLDRESGACAKAIERLRALLGPGEKEKKE